MWLLISSHEKEKNWIHHLTVRAEKQYFWWYSTGSVPRTVERELRGEDSVCQSPDVLNKRGRWPAAPLKVHSTTDSVFHRVRWVFLACSPFMQSHQSCLHLLNLFHREHSCSFWDTGLFFLLTAITTMHMTLEMRYLFRSSYSGCLPTSPSVYPAHRTCILPLICAVVHKLIQVCRSKDGASLELTLWITCSNDCLVTKR